MNARNARPLLVFALAFLIGVTPWLNSGREVVSPGPVVVPKPTFEVPDETFMREGRWGVPTVYLDKAPVWKAVQTTLTGGSLAAAGPGYATGQGAALEAAHSLLRVNAPVWEVTSAGHGLREGDRVIAVKGRVPHSTPAPGTWLVGNVDGFRTVEVRELPALREREKVDLEVEGFRLEKTAGLSGSLLLAVAWVDALTPGDLTGGERIAITGRIEPSGEVFGVDFLTEKQEGAAAMGFEFNAPTDTTLLEVVTELRSR